MFGKSYLLDMYGCTPGVCDSLEVHYRFLEELVYRLNMTAMSAPLVIHAPVTFCPGGVSADIVYLYEKYPDKAGVSAWQPLVESGIQIHSLEPSHFSSLDVYTCGELNPDVVREFAQKVFGFTSYEQHLINRGVNYNDGK